MSLPQLKYDDDDDDDDDDNDDDGPSRWLQTGKQNLLLSQLLSLPSLQLQLRLSSSSSSSPSSSLRIIETWKEVVVE